MTEEGKARGGGTSVRRSSSSEAFMDTQVL